MRFGRMLDISAGAFEQHYNTSHEVQKAIRRTQEWTIPTLQKLQVQDGASILSVGCGSGADVLTLRRQGYAAQGYERHPVLPDVRDHVRVQGSGDAGERWPFMDGQFAVLLMLEVVEHVGVGEAEIDALRKAFFREAKRVTSAAGVWIIATPNRLFPLDEHGEPVRVHSPLRDETVSYSELERLADVRFEPVPMDGYFAFGRFGRTTGLLKLTVGALDPVLSRRSVHKSPLNPHLFLSARVGS